MNPLNGPLIALGAYGPPDELERPPITMQWRGKRYVLVPGDCSRCQATEREDGYDICPMDDDGCEADPRQCWEESC